MPLRRDGDRVEQIEDFDSWIEETLAEAIARGEFDNLPQAGKPIKIERNPYQPELDMAFSRLKNAGMAPAWIELDREIRTMQDALAHWLQVSAGRLAAEASRIQQLSETPATQLSPTKRPWHERWRQRWWPFRHFADIAEEEPALDAETAWQGWRNERRIVRDQYLERAAQLDAKFLLFNNSVPRNLWHLEKVRFLPERAAERFATSVPHINVERW